VPSHRRTPRLSVATFFSEEIACTVSRWSEPDDDAARQSGRGLRG
jgi:hypothetical protein